MSNLNSKSLTKFIHELRVIYELSKRDFQKQYHGSYLGYAWALLLPLIFLLVLYLVFSWGLKIEGLNYGMPFTLYLLTGMVSWNYYSSSLGSMVYVLENHAYLIKEVEFRLSVLPAVPLLGGMIFHSFQVAIAVAFCWYEGFPPTLFTLQVIYYLVAMQALLLGLGWLISSTSLFARDVAKLIEIFVQFSFWLTPIFWNINSVPAQYQWLLKLNPAYYIVNGYRDSLVRGIGFWARPYELLYFWVVTALVAILGLVVFSKLKPHLAEVTQ